MGIVICIDNYSHSLFLQLNQPILFEAPTQYIIIKTRIYQTIVDSRKRVHWKIMFYSAKLNPCSYNQVYLTLVELNKNSFGCKRNTNFSNQTGLFLSFRGYICQAPNLWTIVQSIPSAGMFNESSPLQQVLLSSLPQSMSAILLNDAKLINMSTYPSVSNQIQNKCVLPSLEEMHKGVFMSHLNNNKQTLNQLLRMPFIAN